MYEFLWHGRGGQGAFTAARLLGAAYSLKKDGNYALAFPSFGPERRGAPIRAFTKLDSKKVGNRAEIEKADFAVYLDDTLFNDDAFLELKENGKIILCTKKIFTNSKIITIDGVSIAEKILHLPITNTVILGAIAAVFDEVTVDDLKFAIEQNMPPKLQQRNIEVVKAAFDAVKS